jgi:hypothetical protein
MERKKNGGENLSMGGYLFHFIVFVTVFFAIIGGALFFLHAASAFGG